MTDGAEVAVVLLATVVSALAIAAQDGPGFWNTMRGWRTQVL